MAIFDFSRWKMKISPVPNKLHFICLLSLLECIFAVDFSVVEEHRQAFIQADRELRYLVDGITLQLRKGYQENSGDLTSKSDVEHLPVSSNFLMFSPKTLDFREHPIGMPHRVSVMVSNPSYHINVFLLSISGSSVHFHCSFFQEKVIPPGGNTTFDILFLPRHEGPVLSSVVIHSSIGAFEYHVRGKGVLNPYRLRPFLGAKVPLNSVFSPLIKLYNPYNSTLQVMEMFSSGGDLHLELANGEREASKELWEILPYHTKPVMQVHFLARVESNHTVYICIKTNRSKTVDLILPIEVEVTSAPGIYSMTDSLEFGVFSEKDEPRTLALNLINNKVKVVHLTSISVIPPNKAISVEFHPLKLQPNTSCPVTVAMVTVHPNQVKGETQISGSIVVHSKMKEHRLILSYHAIFLQGSLRYNDTSINFYIGNSQASDRLHHDIILKNSFMVDVAVVRAELPAEAAMYYQIQLYKDVVLGPNETKPVGAVKFQKNVTPVKMNTRVHFHTNTSDFDMPLLCYDGKLNVFISLPWNTSKLDFGTLSLQESRNFVFGVLNDNPVNVTIQQFGATLPHIVLELLAVDSGNVTDVLRKQNFTGMKKSMTLKAFQYAVFRIGVLAPAVEGAYQGSVFLETKFERLHIPFWFKTANGILATVPSSVVFEPSFPGKISATSLHMQNTFPQPMTVTSVTTTIGDQRFFYQPPKGSLPVLQPNSNTFVGKLQFDLKQGCGMKCYSALDLDNPMARKWIMGFTLFPGTAMVDVDLYQKFWSRWKETLESQKSSINITFVVDTNEVHGILVLGQVSLIWPTLTPNTKISFPLTQIGNKSVMHLYLENPSSAAVLIHLVPLHAYPDSTSLLLSLRDRGWHFPLQLGFLTTKVFDILLPNCSKGKHLENFKGMAAHPDTVLLRLESGGSTVVPLQFTPVNNQPQGSLLLIRNNLTILEVVEIYGIGDPGKLEVGNPDNLADGTVLNFKLTEKHLQSCDPGAVGSQRWSSRLSVRRVFSIHNPGKLPVYISGFDVDGVPCEGFGFAVLNCQPFLLAINATRKLDIVFTPDFTLARVARQLNIYTSLSSKGHILVVSLIATVPPHLLPHCASIIPRPQWESIIYYMAVIVMGALFLCVAVFGFLEYDQIIRCRCITMTVTGLQHPLDLPAGAESPAINYGEVFDLNNLGASATSQNEDLQQTSVATDTDSTSYRTVAYGHTTAKLLDHLSRNRDSQFPYMSTNVRTFLHGPNKTSCSSVPPRQTHSVFSKDRSACAVKDPGNDRCKSVGSKRKGRKKSLVFQNPDGETYLVTPIPSQKAVSATLKSSIVECEPLLPLNSGSAGVVMTRKPPSMNDGYSNRQLHPGLGCNTNAVHVRNSSCSGEHKPGIWNGDASIEVKRKSFAVVERHPAEEETSSNTESSSMELDSTDKASQKEPKPVKLKRPSRESRTGTDSSKVDEADDEEEFEVFSKNRPRKVRNYHHTRQRPKKEIKAEVGTMSVKLPCKSSLPSGVRDASKCRDYWEALKLKSKTTKKSAAIKSRALQKVSFETESSSTGKDSPPPEWDHPKLMGDFDEAYSEIANQTESFAMSLGNPQASYGPKSSVTPLFSHERNGRCQEKHFWNSAGDGNRLLPIGKVAPEPKKRDPNVLGPVGQKPLSNLRPAPSMPPWPSSYLRPLDVKGAESSPSFISNSSCHYCLPQFLDYGCLSSEPMHMMPSPSSPYPVSVLGPFPNAEWCLKSRTGDVIVGDTEPGFSHEDNSILNYGYSDSMPDLTLEDQCLGPGAWLSHRNEAVSGVKATGTWDDILSKQSPSTSPTWPSLFPRASNEKTAKIAAESGFHFTKPVFSEAPTANESYSGAEYHPFSTLHNIWTPGAYQQNMGGSPTIAASSWPRSIFSTPGDFSPLPNSSQNCDKDSVFQD